MTAEPPRCRPVEVDGDTVIVRGVGELSDADKEALAAIVRAAKEQFTQRLTERCVCGHPRGEHRIDLQRQYCATGAEIPGYACQAKCQHYTPREA